MGAQDQQEWKSSMDGGKKVYGINDQLLDTSIIGHNLSGEQNSYDHQSSARM